MIGLSSLFMHVRCTAGRVDLQPEYYLSINFYKNIFTFLFSIVLFSHFFLSFFMFANTCYMQCCTSVRKNSESTVMIQIYNQIKLFPHYKSIIVLCICTVTKRVVLQITSGPTGPLGEGIIQDVLYYSQLYHSRFAAGSLQKIQEWTLFYVSITVIQKSK